MRRCSRTLGKPVAAWALIAACLAVSADLPAADWPTYRADAGRTGYCPDPLPAPLSLRWTHRSPHAPRPAWPGDERMTYDRAYQPVLADGRLFYGSSADGGVYCLEADTGRQLWSFFTEGPVRFAPAAWRDRLFVAGDDGRLYCLDLRKGTVLWTRRPGPDDSKVLGNGRVISKWPLRGGPVILDDVLYFGAGIWPSDGVFVCALDPATGKERWVNDKAGRHAHKHPHDAAPTPAGTACQGYLAAAGDVLVAPTGRGYPAYFRRSDGQLNAASVDQGYKQHDLHGGDSAVIVDGRLLLREGLLASLDDPLAGVQVFPPVRRFGHKAKVKQLETAARESALCVTATPEWIVWGDRMLPRAQPIGGEAAAQKAGMHGRYTRTVRAAGQGPDVKGRLESFVADCALIAAGGAVVGGGKDGRIMLADLKSGKVAWSATVEGAVYGLAASAGRLYASTDRGVIYCFAAEGPAAKDAAGGGGPEEPHAPADPAYAAAAEEIVRKTGIVEGYCVDLGCGDGRLACELARRTRLTIYGIEKDEAQVARARAALSRAGLYGARVTVLHADPAKVGLPRYFANLIVSARSLEEAPGTSLDDIVSRIQRPNGGAACFGRPGEMRVGLRGPLAGAGAWTHQYAGPANTACSEDALVKGPLGMLWFEDIKWLTPNRHGRPPAPLFQDGILVMEGMDGLMAVDAYNGRVLWTYESKDILDPLDTYDDWIGTAGQGSNYCIGQGAVFIRRGKRCVRLDLKTGRPGAELALPAGADGPWGYLAHADGTVFGSVANSAYSIRGLLTESSTLFALDEKTGQARWTYKAACSIRHNAIAVSDGRVHLIDRPIAKGDALRLKAIKAVDHPPGDLLALDGRTGAVVWKAAEKTYGTVVMVSAKHDVLLASYLGSQCTLYSDKPVAQGGAAHPKGAIGALEVEGGGRMAAFRASTGERLWDAPIRHNTRPVIVDRTIYTEPYAWDLLSGKRVVLAGGAPWHLVRTCGCGTFSASGGALFYRSGPLGYCDLETNQRRAFGGIRPGCWINAIPAGGILLMPEASHPCDCNYLNKCWVALAPAG